MVDCVDSRGNWVSHEPFIALIRKIGLQALDWQLSLCKKFVIFFIILRPDIIHIN